MTALVEEAAKVPKPTGATLADAILNSLPHPVFLLDRGDHFCFANAAAEAFFQTSFSVLSKRTLAWYVASGSPIRALVDQVLHSGSPVSEYRIDLASPRLEGERWVDVYVSPDIEQEGRVVVMLQVRSMAETMDRQLTHRGAARTVTGLAAMLAHEIKNPLSGIRGAAQLLESNGSDDDRALTRLITDETDRIVRLVDRMEVFSDERPIERQPVNVHAVLENVKRLAQSGFARGISICELYDPSLPSVPGNRDQLTQVILNLVKNACEAMKDVSKPELTLRTAFRPGVRIAAPGSPTRVSLPIAISIEDNGPGVPEDMQAYMFDPFITTKTNGSGLGLALVAKIVGDHGGVVSCDSSAGRTVFHVLLPMWNEMKERNDG